ncbi:hypothetical protein [Streptomyces sp. NPDC090445]|uniref:hypothetical protein n=1 Tax=Streptomyces sp. NPDC090445 TaxID=3365963 RepID=UPI00380C6A09
MSNNVPVRKTAIATAPVCALTGGALAASIPAATAATAAPPRAGRPRSRHRSRHRRGRGGPGGHGRRRPGEVTPVEARGPSGLAPKPSVLAPKISRTETIRRAKNWVGKGLKYSWTDYYQGHRMDCSGCVSMAWKLGASLTTDTFGPRGVTERISKNELKPGDALLNNGSPANRHVVLFEKWADDSRTSYIGFEFTPSGVHHRKIPTPTSPDTAPTSPSATSPSSTTSPSTRGWRSCRG